MAKPTDDYEQAVNPKLLIFVEGTSGNNFPVEKQANMAGYWWGGQQSTTTFCAAKPQVSSMLLAGMQLPLLVPRQPSVMLRLIAARQLSLRKGIPQLPCYHLRRASFRVPFPANLAALQAT